MTILSRIRTSFAIALLGLLIACISLPAQAHPMGNFAICHYTRIVADRGGLRLRYLLDMAEIPTLEEKQRADRNGDGSIDSHEQADYLSAKARDLAAGLSLTVDGRPAPLQVVVPSMRFSPGAAGLDTLKIVLDLQAPCTWTAPASHVAYRDGNYAARTGWKEVVATGGEGAILRDSSVPSAGRSRELSVYPADASVPQDTEARFVVTLSGKKGNEQATTAAGTVQRPNALTPQRPATPRDAFTEAINHKQLTPGFILGGLLIAFVFGAFHALGPGHGKAMVAAYLVGARGTAKHAAILGAVVTITHTLGVFLLGFATLFASRYVVPEKLYPILSAISGLSVVSVGVWLFWRRLRGIAEDHHHHHHDHAHDHHHDHEHSHDHAHHTHDHSHDHDHSHSRGHHHHHHHHMPEGPITARALIALGISGGLVPCPSALVVLLAAVSLHRIAYGMALIAAFSLGLASVLILIGLLVVWGRSWMDRLPSGGALLQRLPVASAAMITVIGVVLLVRAFAPMNP